MKHFDEHTLTLFVLGSDEISRQADAIEAHLRVCHGCRITVEELRSIYENVARDLKESGEERPERALVRMTRDVITWDESSHVRIRPTRLSLRKRVVSYARQHPVAAGSWVMILAFLVFFSARGVWDTFSFTQPGQPSFTRLNGLGTAVEVYDRNSSMLWSFPLEDGRSLSEREGKLNSFFTQIADLRGDGQQEVITSTPYLEGQSNNLNVLRIFDPRGKLLLSRSIGKPSVFRGAEYPLFYNLAAVLAITDEQSAGKEILVSALSHRSPYFLTRLNNAGETLGEYWHYGWLAGLRSVAIQGRGRDLVALYGVNDVGDAHDSSFPSIAILDPAKLRGSTEASASRGFGLPVSTAELFYVRAELPRFPIPPDSNCGKEAFQSLKIAQDSSLVFLCTSRTVDGAPVFLFTFDNKMHLRAVSLDDHSRQLMFTRYLTDHGPHALDRFMQRIAGGISYWDGRKWRKDPTEVTQEVLSN
ncbi:MAG TPA: hypothetical protein VEO56_13840 [Bacteroidota bacterium]|nr:hypothetical protein [Bacteroidota bacterium]